MSHSGVELVYFTGCPNTDRARENIRSALREIGRAKQWVEWDLEDGATPERYRSYGSPTVLVGGKDVADAQAAATGLVQCGWRPFDGADRDSVRRRRGIATRAPRPKAVVRGGGTPQGRMHRCSNGRDTSVTPHWSRSNLRSPAAFPLLRGADLIRGSDSDRRSTEPGENTRSRWLSIHSPPVTVRRSGSERPLGVSRTSETEH